MEDTKDLIDFKFEWTGKDYDKIAHEDESYLLFLLNRDVNRLKSPLKTAFIYGIIG